ncbi:cryptochrome/photolyase family protein [Reichenbachiella ulvae]|uniref:cryptochrome/photolyase family protein n=1 Tax=Reichenbachiella ulvae TaxID=2980104 RepID=UPI00298F497B|nr:deoxyribodipyrimidine photo-lyase [Reichenbachiella ulvae]
MRRDLRLFDNKAILKAKEFNLPIILLFIFDDDIINELKKDDPRITFIYQQLKKINDQLNKNGSSILIKKGKPLEVWNELKKSFNIINITCARDYEPYAQSRDKAIFEWAKQHGINFIGVKDQVIFEKNEVLKKDGKPYTVYTPYKNKWLEQFQQTKIEVIENINYELISKSQFDFPTLEILQLQKSKINVLDYDISVMEDYGEFRDIPHKDRTSYLSPHLRFGTVSIRQLVLLAKNKNETFLSELIWREFFMQILYHFPHVIDKSFKEKYDRIPWINNEEDFEKWCEGKTGYPLVDAGMRQLNQTGYMHNRVRMVVASFLCKHLLIDWRWGEAYFAEKLLDYELSSNNGNWQWAAGSGCDAAPYFRVFNPTSQLDKFDKELKYVKKWVPEYDTPKYPNPLVEHRFARQRALDTYKSALG